MHRQLINIAFCFLSTQFVVSAHAAGTDLFMPCESTKNDPRFQALWDSVDETFISDEQLPGDYCAAINSHQFLLIAKTFADAGNGLWEIDTKKEDVAVSSSWSTEKVAPGYINTIDELDAKDGKHYALIQSGGMMHGESWGDYYLVSATHDNDKEPELDLITLLTWGDNSGCLGYEDYCKTPDDYIDIDLNPRWHLDTEKAIPNVAAKDIEIPLASQLTFKVTAGKKSFSLNFNVDNHGKWTAPADQLQQAGFKKVQRK